MSAPRIQPLRLHVLPGRFAVIRLAPTDALPAWVLAAAPCSIVRTGDELSIACEEHLVPADIRAERGWAWLALAGPFDFALTGILASVLQPLAAAGVSIFAMSTFDTDHVLVKQETLAPALAALRAAGHDVITRRQPL